jgi:biopolymer transport protein ExbD
MDKKYVSVLLTILMIFISTGTFAFENKHKIGLVVGERNITIGNKPTIIESEPIEKDGKIYIDINTLKHLKGIDVSFDQATKKVSISQDRPKIYFNGAERNDLIKLIKTSKTIYIEMYTLTSKEILDAINIASKNKAKIRLILDKSQKANTSFDGKNNTEKYLEKNDCIVRWRGGKSGNLNSMHRKMAVFDNKIFYLGSTNWTNSGFFYNFEVGMLYDDKENASLLSNEFLNDWKTARDEK